MNSEKLFLKFADRRVNAKKKIDKERKLLRKIDRDIKYGKKKNVLIDKILFILNESFIKNNSLSYFLD